MAYLLWALLNIGLVLFFITTCFKVAKLISEKIGLLATIIFVFGFLSFTGSADADKDKKEPNSNRIKPWNFASEDSLDRNATSILNVDLEKTSVSKYCLGIKFGKDKQAQMNIPISAYSTTTGFICGTNWKPLSIIVSKSIDNKFDYFVYGEVEWNLLGATLCRQAKAYEGSTLTK